MRLKPSLFQLSVVLMVASLLVACTSPASRPECQVPLEQRPPNCASSGTSTIYRSGGAVYRSGGSGASRTGRPNVSSGGRKGSSSGSKSTTTTGRSGFGSFGRGGASS